MRRASASPEAETSLDRDVQGAQDTPGCATRVVPELSNSARQEALRALNREGGGGVRPPFERWSLALRRHEDQVADAWIDTLSPEERGQVMESAAELNPSLLDEPLEKGGEEDGDALPAGTSPLPHIDQIQAAFGAFDLSAVRALVGGAAAEDLDRRGAEGGTSGAEVALLRRDLWTEAHEAAHVVQQSAGVHLVDRSGRPGDNHEREADEIADRVEQGDSAVDLLEQIASPGPIFHRPQGVQLSGGLPDPPLSDDKLRGLSKEQLQELYNKMRRTDPQEALKVKWWQKNVEFRGSSVKKSGASKKSLKKATEELAEEGGEKIGKKIVKKGLGAVAKKIPVVGIGFFIYDWVSGGVGHAVNELTWPVSELWAN